MKKLISMTDFVLEQNEKWVSEWAMFKILKYAKFLKKPLELWMFVPCDEEGNVLELPIVYDGMDSHALEEEQLYFKAKDRVLFEGFEFYAGEHHIKMGRNIEYLSNFGTLTLTASALKQIS